MCGSPRARGGLALGGESGPDAWGRGMPKLDKSAYRKGQFMVGGAFAGIQGARARGRPALSAAAAGNDASPQAPLTNSASFFRA
jgi:hypothetical protein